MDAGSAGFRTIRSQYYNTFRSELQEIQAERRQKNHEKIVKNGHSFHFQPIFNIVNQWVFGNFARKFRKKREEGSGADIFPSRAEKPASFVFPQVPGTGSGKEGIGSGERRKTGRTRAGENGFTISCGGAALKAPRRQKRPEEGSGRKDRRVRRVFPPSGRLRLRKRGSRGRERRRGR